VGCWELFLLVKPGRLGFNLRLDCVSGEEGCWKIGSGERLQSWKGLV